MYIPECFVVRDDEEIFSFIERNGFGQLVSAVAGRMASTHMPFLLSEDRATLTGHLARCNPQCQELDGQEVLITMLGAHGYVSPSWYGKAGVPTWNYQSVHIYGTCRVFDCQERLEGVVNALSRHFEASVGQSWQGQFDGAMLRAIIGVEIKVAEVQCQYKLSQDRSEEDRQGVISGLRAAGTVQLAETMEKYDV
ncbi:transcriptional regulator [Microbulbifer flavimaris]|uniref:Transcriptional regulator n=1 Tax=Microbulbifer flavimaris TaxID=1781068 RepID=A0ABX4I0L6_9GAMM|nr:MULTISPECIES: FMN-binding negative transcriptional regulator [Microbulbifer]KUJ83760.1 transcriptional regulator [Microbulbifer sp. ZGT114]PCO05934.1 transcriptional regulator [Microbulbifer flavimaris]